MTPKEIGLKIIEIGADVEEDPFELFRAATSGSREAILISHDKAVDTIESMIDGLDETALVQIDRIVFEG